MALLDVDLRDADAVSLQLELRGRRFPEPWNTTAEQPTGRVRKLRESARELPLSKQLETALWNRLAWSELPSDTDQRQLLVESYVRSLNQLDGFRREVDALVRAACHVNLEFRQGTGVTHEEARDAAMSSRLDEMLAAASAAWLPARNVLNGPVVSQSGPALREQLDRTLRDAVCDFSTSFFDLLARLVDRQLMGLVEWLPKHCCSYHFFKQVVIQENDGGGHSVHETLFADPDRRNAGRPWVIGRRTTVDSRGEGRHYHRLARHEHAVMNAVRTSIRNSRVVIPPQVGAMLKHIPDWLYPFVEVIDGDIVRERIIERDLKVEQWQDAVVRDEPIYGCEPGVIIGPYVLTGWGPREIQAEQTRRDTARLSQVRRSDNNLSAWRSALFATAGVVMALLALVLLTASLSGRGGSLFALLAVVSAIGAVWQATFDYLTIHRRGCHAATAAHWLTASFGCQLLMALWLVARWFGPLPWSIPIILGILAVLCYAVGRRFC